MLSGLYSGRPVLRRAAAPVQPLPTDCRRGRASVNGCAASAGSHFLPSNSSDFNLTVAAAGDAGENAYGVCAFTCYNSLNASALPLGQLVSPPVLLRPIS